ncbi:MAG: L,D-transpeptidase [Hapalosiphonaceae cyanobacterium JJU2]|nr:MAG: L,D-transpeptidase [Hapalosiphonaceae cyanobacterium JJU2]
MAMVRNESVTRMAMLLCFGTGFLSLAVHWYVSDLIKSPTNQEPGGMYVARATDTIAKPKSFIPEEKHKANFSRPIQSQLAKASATQKPSSVLASADQTHVIVDLSDRRVYVQRQNQVIASYPTGIGKKGWETPTGSFQIENMRRNPIWRHPITNKVFPAGVNSPLGDRWIGFWSDGHNKIGFHGTPDDSLVGSAVSHGCLRMRTPDVRLLYQQVRLGTTVEVRQ